MERTWTKVGREVFEKSVDEGGHDITRKTIVRAIEQVEWRAVGTDGRLANVPMMPAHGIMAAIQECRIPKVSHIAWSNQLAPNGFYAIRGHYSDGDCEVYVVDMGTHLVPVCSDFHPKTEAVNAR